PLVAIAVHQAGLELQLCDLRPGHYDMDPQALRTTCDERTLAILPTHLAGRDGGAHRAALRGLGMPPQHRAARLCRAVSPEQLACGLWPPAAPGPASRRPEIGRA